MNSAESLTETIRGQRLWAALAGTGLAALLIVGIGHAAIGTAAPTTSASNSGNLTGLAQLIFTTYVYPFEITSALLITAALGAMVLALHNAVDMPAMLPDGTTTARSVSTAVTQRDVALGRDPQGGLTADLAAGERIESERQIEAGARGLKGEGV